MPSSSGVRYTNGLMEVRSVGSPMQQQGLVYIRDGKTATAKVTLGTLTQ